MCNGAPQVKSRDDSRTDANRYSEKEILSNNLKRKLSLCLGDYFEVETFFGKEAVVLISI